MEKDGLLGIVDLLEIKRAVIQPFGNEYPGGPGKEEFLQALAQGEIHGRKTGMAIHLFSTWARVKKKFPRKG